MRPVAPMCEATLESGAKYDQRNHLHEMKHSIVIERPNECETRCLRGLDGGRHNVEAHAKHHQAHGTVGFCGSEISIHTEGEEHGRCLIKYKHQERTRRNLSHPKEDQREYHQKRNRPTGRRQTSQVVDRTHHEERDSKAQEQEKRQPEKIPHRCRPSESVSNSTKQRGGRKHAVQPTPQRDLPGVTFAEPDQVACAPYRQHTQHQVRCSCRQLSRDRIELRDENFLAFDSRLTLRVPK